MPKAKRRPLDFGVRYRALQKTNGSCPYCGVRLGYHYEYGASVAIDHVIPLARAGIDEPENLIACCSTCNARKHTKTGLEFLCEQMGHKPHWFATFNPELDGYSAPDPEDDDFPYDTAAYRACFQEIDDPGYVDDHAIQFELEESYP